MRKKLMQIAIGIFFIVGIGMLALPVIFEHADRQNIKKAIQEMNEQLMQCDEESIERQKHLAQWYNLNLSAPKPEENFTDAYIAILDYKDHMMGQIQFPTLGVTLPIYHGVSDDILEKGMGHLPETAFPIGGEGNHSVLVGETELPCKELFTDVSQLKQGDLFYIHILQESLVYQVDKVEKAMPDQVDDISSVSGEDLCTLVTCTPGSNRSDCLLIQGRRTEIPAQEVFTKDALHKPGWIGIGITASLLAGIIPLLIMGYWKIPKKC